MPDPNLFGGNVEALRKGGEWTTSANDLPFSDGNYRSLGLADMADAIRRKRPHRANGALALHVLEVMEAVGKASEANAAIDMTTTLERPAPLAQSLIDGRFA